MNTVKGILRFKVFFGEKKQLYKEREKILLSLI